MGDVRREGERGAAAADPIPIKGTYIGGGRPIATPDLVAWLLEHGRSIEQIAAFVDELCWRTVATGLPLWRVTLHTATLHPQIGGVGCRWWRDRGVTEEFTITIGAEESPDFLSSPLRDSVLNGEVARFRLAATQDREYPMLRAVQFSERQVDGGGDGGLAKRLIGRSLRGGRHGSLCPSARGVEHNP